jgi:hypothetical protein
MRRRKLNPVARLLSMAKDSAGARAVAAAERQDYEASRMWRSLAVEIDRLLRNSVELMARPSGGAE